MITPTHENLITTVLPPESSKPARNQAALVGGIESITATIREQLEEIRRLEDDALNRALLIGILQEMAKRIIPHGGFSAWREREFDKSRSLLRFYHLLAMRRLCEVGLMQGTGKHTPMQLPMPDDMSNLNVATVISAKHQQLIFDWGDDRPASIREALDRYRIKLDPKRRGGDHGGGAAMKERAGRRSEIEAAESQEQWQHIVAELRDFALRRRRHFNVPPHILQGGIESINECLRQVEKAAREK